MQKKWYITFFCSQLLLNILAERMYILQGMSIPSRKDAYRFAQEGICEDSEFTGIPLGIHAAWNYHPRARMQELLHLTLPD
jgi:hypothetical protein